MNNLPTIIPRNNLRYHWIYLDSDKKTIAIVARYDEVGKQKRFHQFRICKDGNWVEGAPTPSPIFGIDTVPNSHFEGFVYIFEGEKCAQAAHYLGIPAITSMMGSSQGHLADWAILASYRHVKSFVLVPDNDDPGEKFMHAVYDEIKKACPNAEVMVCELSASKKGDDFVDWLKEQSSCPHDWDGFLPLDDLNYECLKEIFEMALSKSSISEEVYKKSFKKSLDNETEFSFEFPCEEPPKEPKKKRYKTDDPTVEKLGEILIENPQGILLYRDELSGWLRSFGKSGRENDRQFFLESWSGKKDFDVDRIGRGSLHVPALFLSIFWGIQPGPLSQYVRSTIKGDVGDDGFFQRFSMMVWPDVKSDWELVDGVNIKAGEAKVAVIFEYLDKLAFDDEDNPIILNFTHEAQKVFDEWQKALELRLRAGSLPNHLEAHFAKYKKLLPALCLIHEHLKLATSGYPEVITLESLECSVLWVEYLESHALRVYGSGANAIPKAATELLSHIKGGDIVEPFSVRDVYYGHHWSGLTTSDEVEEVLDYLVDKGYLGCAMIKTNGRPSQKYWVHPKVFEE